MSNTFLRYPQIWATGLTLVVPLLSFVPSAEAGLHPKRGQAVVPIMSQQVPTASYYAAPAPMTTTTIYSAPAPAVYQVQQAPMQQVQYPYPNVAGNAPGKVGSAPGALVGAKVVGVERDDIIEELRKEYKEADKTTSRRERRKALKESAVTKFKESIGDESELGTADTQDVDSIVNWIIDGSEPNPGTAANNGYGNGNGNGNGNGYGYGPQVQALPYSAPAQRYVPVAGAPLFQPVVPVQMWVPTQPKHRLFHRQ